MLPQPHAGGQVREGEGGIQRFWMEERLTHTLSGCMGASSGREGGGLLQPWSQPRPRACRLLALPAPGASWLLGSLSKDGGWGCFLPPLPIPPQPASVGNRHRKWPHQALERQRTWGGNSWGHKRGRRGGGGPSPGVRSPSSRPESQLPSPGGAVGSPRPQGPSGQRGSRSRRASSASSLPCGPCPALGDVRGSAPAPQPGAVAPGTLLFMPPPDALPCLPRFAQPWPAGLLPGPLRYVLKQLCPPEPLASCLSVCWPVFEG